MSVSFRKFNHTTDYNAISAFLIKHYQPGNRDGNWFYAIWEYCYTLRCTEYEHLRHIGIWEDRHEIVAAAIFETNHFDIGLMMHPAYTYLYRDMLAYAEEHLFGIDSVSGKKFINVFGCDFDAGFTELMRSAGYVNNKSLNRVMSQFIIPKPFPQPRLTPGYWFKNLTEDNDPVKINRVLHRGFNHPGEPDHADIAGRRLMQTGPHFMPRLTTVIEAPNGDWVTYCGMWYDAVNHYGYVEPVCTDPAYRRMGLGSATVLESIRKVGEEGADVAFVWTDMPFYLSFGFKPLFTHLGWTKQF